MDIKTTTTQQQKLVTIFILEKKYFITIIIFVVQLLLVKAMPNHVEANGYLLMVPSHLVEKNMGLKLKPIFWFYTSLMRPAMMYVATM